MAGTDPIHQFVITDLIPIHVGDEAAGTALNLSFTNSALFMAVTVVILTGFMVLSSSRAAMVPNRFQMAGELLYSFVANMLRSSAGTEGMKFFPFVFSLFGFVLVGNLLGMFPYFFTTTSHIIVTAALAFLVIGVVIVYGFFRHGFKFLKLFVPSGVPGYVLPIVVPIEIISFLSRPISLSVRLFGNILAGHITLKVFSGFVVSLGALGALGWLGALLPLIMTVAITALELLVAVVQAYVFAVLTSMYLNDAVHPSH
ncbi:MULTISPECIES: F0F1 ATP synthase subunit A [unclassified Devosia]|uniref:F0F1 ATP synthase subunit A n=1 Tax=unclassified Devosia TaxID=196773 RepID=UPI00145E8C06|nr:MULTISPECIES: F0F1 ATP synthase subunit A [unclassified Devosia]MBJ6988260.1 F0F1 ATP synthase subunit A [Devosia sp. MC521]MBJ7577574.1 F0F1 ATP synthase subunit A [Devosia sp. MC532]MBK1794517.1 F0F1 ATP synthase subunit A [Devosia sp. WQ 349K1]QMW63228.1 F0F1 ATP synthase subunit A [Devosia sp. MC521]